MNNQTIKGNPNYYIDHKKGEVSLLVNGKSWHMPLDYETFTEIAQEYARFHVALKGDGVEDVLINDEE